MSYSLNSLDGVIICGEMYGSIIGLIKGHTRSLEYSPYELLSCSTGALITTKTERRIEWQQIENGTAVMWVYTVHGAIVSISLATGPFAVDVGVPLFINEVGLFDLECDLPGFLRSPSHAVFGVVEADCFSENAIIRVSDIRTTSR